ncbi:RepB plasmid partition [Roseospira marina]|uniref:RepB plasmid partition n=1 Tax=Roseospira marina TaxID=140057 RepID=A0A5M6I8W1_9PROT|nr:plasmid partitioning protein RepB C-terminal domain-containing protein [Roseospira marina]KAA5604245.1 RepB plasmid partition [Roseospira marina]MBB4315608.1 ParB-like chromosome segregation protein Spo0J [Roseospira marina]MBB5088604.1 ParB-like chromosome segregation protein Spo0J [Roseospira marina]
MRDETRNTGTRVAFEHDCKVVALTHLVPLKILRPGTKESQTYQQILGSIRLVGLVEPPAVIPDPDRSGRYLLLDGHLRIEALKDLGITEVKCLIATDDETYTYNKRVSRIPPIQQNRMILRAIKLGVPEEKIAEAFHLNIQTIKRRTRLLEGICADAAEILKDAPCPAASFDVLRRMASMRQVEAAELMVGQNNFTAAFAKAILAATPEAMIVDPRKKKQAGERAVTAEQISRLERELASLQIQVKSVEDTYGLDNLHLTLAKGYVRKLLGNPRVVAWLSRHRQEYLTEFQSIAEIESIAPVTNAAQ